MSSVRLMCPCCFRMRDNFTSAHLLVSKDSTTLLPCMICKKCTAKLFSLCPFQLRKMYDKVGKRVAVAPESFNSVLCTDSAEIEQVFWDCIRQAPMKDAGLARKLFEQADFRNVRESMKQEGKDDDATR